VGRGLVRLGAAALGLLAGSVAGLALLGTGLWLREGRPGPLGLALARFVHQAEIGPLLAFVAAHVVAAMVAGWWFHVRRCVPPAPFGAAWPGALTGLGVGLAFIAWLLLTENPTGRSFWASVVYAGRDIFYLTMPLALAGGTGAAVLTWLGWGRRA